MFFAEMRRGGKGLSQNDVFDMIEWKKVIVHDSVSFRTIYLECGTRYYCYCKDYIAVQKDCQSLGM